eukprot:237886-Hanusia_phi.AAC.5
MGVAIFDGGGGVWGIHDAEEESWPKWRRRSRRRRRRRRRKQEQEQEQETLKEEGKKESDRVEKDREEGDELEEREVDEEAEGDAKRMAGEMYLSAADSVQTVRRDEMR